MRSERSESVVSSVSLVGLLLGSTCGRKPCSTFHDVMVGALKKTKEEYQKSSNLRHLVCTFIAVVKDDVTPGVI